MIIDDVKLEGKSIDQEKLDKLRLDVIGEPVPRKRSGSTSPKITPSSNPRRLEAKKAFEEQISKKKSCIIL